MKVDLADGVLALASKRCFLCSAVYSHGVSFFVIFFIRLALNYIHEKEKFIYIYIFICT